MKIAIASDHAGFELKFKIKNWLESAGYEVIDHGTYESSESVDYPDYALPVAEDVRMRRAERGVLICGTGIGMCIAANKVKGIRAANVRDLTTARLASAHNSANIITLGSRLIAFELAVELIECWLSTPFEPRHQKRIEKISSIENMK
jgi:ribose 5-phosphate isomerase B